MESEFRYRLTQKAEADLDDIVAYMAVQLANSKAASDFVDKLQLAIQEVRSFPESGVLVENEFLTNHEVRKKLVGNYIMYYLPDFSQETIYVLRIVYGRRNMEEILRKMNEKD